MDQFLSLQAKLLILIILLFLSPLSQAITNPSGTIERTKKQQILAIIPPNAGESTQPFLTSPSGKYTAYLLRRETAAAAGGFGNDFCYIQVQDTSSEKSMWESECAPVSTANTCALIFSDKGLEVFDGSHSVWDDRAEGDFLETLELVDGGDMRIIDRRGELAWKASDVPRDNQGCGLAGSSGFAPESPPFARPIGGGPDLPFGQQGQAGQQQEQLAPEGLEQQLQPLEGDQESNQQPVGIGSQLPLVDNNAFDSGSIKGVESWYGLGWAILALWVHGLLI